MSETTTNTTSARKRIIVFHGSRQTGDLLLGRMDKLRKRLAKLGYDLEAPTAVFPHPEDPELRHWWNWKPGTNEYHGFLGETLPQLLKIWNSSPEKGPAAVGFLGFSQGARLAHLLTELHERQPDCYFTGLQFSIMVAGYVAPTPDGMNELCPAQQQQLLQTKSLHVWGSMDRLITPDQSESLAALFMGPVTHVHDGGHHVPMRAANVRTYVDFIVQAQASTNNHSAAGLDSSIIVERSEGNRMESSDNQHQPEWATTNNGDSITEPSPSNASTGTEPDEETKQIQQDEVEAMAAIFPDEFELLSSKDTETEQCNEFPIEYQIALPRTEEGVWPPHPLSLHVLYPPTYPHSTGPVLSLVDENNVFEFSYAQRDTCAAAMEQAVQAEEGMPCVYSCYVAAKEFFESGVMAELAKASPNIKEDSEKEDDEQVLNGDSLPLNEESLNNKIRPCSPERARICNQQGLEIAASILKQLGTVKFADPKNREVNSTTPSTTTTPNIPNDPNRVSSQVASQQFKGGHWTYTIGLVGKPSAGKSTFFNAATAFARQRDDADNILGGATMAPHPFTTIDANLGFCLVPAPKGLCPEDDMNPEEKSKWNLGSTHGRDPTGRRFIPVLLKDVAGLVPGAYQGRGRGNKFLNDLTDADVLVHVLDASGTADVEGNDLGVEQDADGGNDQVHSSASHPLEDMEWIRKELQEWVYANLMYKWETVTRKGRSKLMGMFSGYGQSHGLLSTILTAVENFMETTEQRDHALDNVYDWDEGDVRRLVSAFLGVRFPMALALNKSDLPTSKVHIADIQQALPVHGAYSGTPLCAKQEMLFMRRRLEGVLANKKLPSNDKKSITNNRDSPEKVPIGVWSCLTSALSLHEPILVFPVFNFTDYAPLPGLNKYATGDPSLPSFGMVACLEAAGGQGPSLWDPSKGQYTLPTKRSANSQQHNVALRDAIVMKPGSTIEDVFVALKNRRALEGEFVRAEAAPRIGAPSRPVPKHHLLDKNNLILKIMTNKKKSWQGNYK